MRWPRRHKLARELETTGRDPAGRLYDGDRVRPPGYARWVDLLPVRRVDETTRLLPGLHTPRRPGWDCRECDRQWPCPQARAELATHFGALLPRTMARLVELAAADGLAADLYPRMIEWTEPVKLHPAGAAVPVPRRSESGAPGLGH